MSRVNSFFGCGADTCTGMSRECAMLTRLKERFLFETRLAIHIVRRERLRRISLLPVVSGTMILVGDNQAAASMALMVLLSEIAAFLAGAGQRLDGPPPGPFQCVMVWIVAVVTTVAYMHAAYYFADRGSTAMLICAFVWMFGSLVFISNTFVAVPFYNWSMIVPAYLMVLKVVYDIYDRDFSLSYQMEGSVVAGLLVIYFANTVQTTKNQKDTLSAFESMRELANSRLQELEDLSLRDVLTSLPNRRAFDRILQGFLISETENKSGKGALFLIDLDGFKPINDSYGHIAGDVVLRAVADRLSDHLDGAGVVSRLGGDEFAITWPGHLSKAEMTRIAENILELIRRPVAYDHRQLQVSASIGIAPVRRGATAEMLMKEGDQAMYQAKISLETSAVIYDVKSFPPRLTLDDRARLIAAMDRSEIAPFYQPQIDIESGRIVGLEALARWTLPSGERRAPAAFLPAINEMGLQADFQMHILRAVLSNMGQLKQAHLIPDQVSINLSEVTLATNTGREALISAVARHPELRPHLTFEVTEDIFIARAGRTIQDSISTLRLAGVRISLDDFGTGFASLKHLQELEFDELKLDTGFVRKLGQDRATDILVKTCLDLGRGLGVSVVAEGVETQTQLDILRGMGCPIVQGYYFSAAVSFQDTIDLLKKDAATAAA